MSLATPATVEGLHYYSIKGLSSTAVRHVNLQANDGFPGDRLFGFAKANSGFDRANPKPLPKDRFLVLAQQGQLAKLKTSFDTETHEFFVLIDDEEALRTNLATEDGRAKTSDFFVNLLKLSDDERPFFAEAAPHRFTDVSVVSETMMNAVSLINLASVKEFEGLIGKPVDPARFRGNVLFDGLPAFSEFDLIGQTIRVGGVSLKVLMRTKRCAATEVDPVTGKRDLAVPFLLRKTYGHFDMGVYAQVVSDGTISLGDGVSTS